MAASAVKLNVGKTKGERRSKKCLFVSRQPEECGANLVETSGTGLNFTRPKAQLSIITHTQKKCDIYLVNVY